MEKQVKTVCKECTVECNVFVSVKDGKAVKVKGNPDCAHSKGHICSQGRNFIEGTLYHPDRLLYPMKRSGKRGEGKWDRISWDTAIDEISERILDIRQKHGPLSLACGVDGWHYVLTGQLTRALGSPNIMATIEHCEGAGALMDRLLIGGGCTQFGHGPDCEHSQCILAWGKNVIDTNPPEWRHILEARSKGAKLIVIDPRKTIMAERADIWLQPRPASDGALALAMINVIINEGLFDRDFVNKWTYGFEKLKERAQQFTPEKAQEISWVDADDIRRAARLFATTKPGCLLTGIGISQKFGSTATAHGQVCLVAITGNIDVKGGNLLMTTHPPSGFFSAYKFISQSNPEHIEKEEIADKRMGADQFPIWAGRYSNYSAPHTESMIKAMITGKPYPVKGLITHGQNMICQIPNARETFEALKSLDLFVTFNYMANPTTELADYVLPVATWMERDEIPLFSFIWSTQMRPRVKAIEPLGEARDEQQAALDIYWKLIEKGLTPVKSRTGEDFIKWKTLEEFLDYCLKGIGLTWSQFKEKGYVENPYSYRTYEKGGFQTPSGKIELYSNILEKYGHDPLPTHREPPESHISTPDQAKQYPLIITTSRIKGNLNFHSSNRWAEWFRKRVPDPLTEIHKETAGPLGIEDGDWIWIETIRGRIKQRAKVSDSIHPKVINVQPGWWFPEKGAPFYGCFESNHSVLATSDEPYDPLEGTCTFGAMLGKVYKMV